jgi:hypothetical protein
MSSAEDVVLPEFTPEGVLPAGDYSLTLNQLEVSMLVIGPTGGYPEWDAEWRKQLVRNLRSLANQLWLIGAGPTFINGSFVEDKDHPNDIDGYFECDEEYFISGRLERDLNRRDPFGAWTWDPSRRLLDPNSGKRQLPMWFKYRVELYPHFGQPTGVQDQFGNDLVFPALFRVSRRNYMPKGIVRIAKP